MTRALEKTAIGKFLKFYSRFDKRLLRCKYSNVHVTRQGFNSVILTLDYYGCTYTQTYNIKDLV